MIEIPGYRVVRQLGRGGMASVYLAIQESVDREVALKVMSPHLLADPNFGERFLREARIAAKLQHRHVVGVHDVGRHHDLHYIAMEYLEGGPILSKDGGARDVTFSLRVTREIASALGYAHSKGFVHRDVKPDNILMRDDGTSALTDFGIARANDSATRMTRTGAVIGTPHYMSPEQARGRQIDGRADLYSLGIVLYELVMGRVPFHADDSLAVGIMHITEPVPRLPDELADLQRLLDRLLAKAPEDRFQSGDEVAETIREYELSIAHGELPNLFAPTPEQSRKILERLPGGNRVTPLRSSGDAGNPALTQPLPITGPTPSVSRDATPTNNARARNTPPIGADRAQSEAPTATRGRAEPTIGRFDDIVARERPRSADAKPPKRGRSGIGWALFAVLLVAAGAAAWMYQDRLRGLIPETEQNTQLAEADRALAAGDLVGTNGTSARERYLQILRVDPDNAQALAGTRKVGEQLLSRAQAALSRGDMAQARTLAQSAREVLGGGPEIDELDTRIKETESTAGALDALLESAIAAREAGRLVGGDDAAISYYQKALEIDAANGIALSGIKDILGDLSKRAEEALANGDAATAQSLTEQIAQISPSHPSLPDLRANLALAASRAKDRIADLLAEAELHMRNGAITAPAGNNALERFRQVLAAEPDNAAARAGLRRIGGSLIVQAQAAIDANDPDGAESLVRKAEAIGAPSADLAAVKSGIRELRERNDIAKSSAIDADQQARIDALLAEGDAELAAGNLMDPPGANAYDKYRAALAIDRDNARAKQSIASIPERAKALFAGAIEQRRNNTARSFLDVVETIRSDDPDLPDLRAELARAWLAQAEQQIASAQLDAAAKSIAKARALAPAEPGIAEIEGRLRAAGG